MKLLSFIRSASIVTFCASLIVAFVALLTVATPDVFAHGLLVMFGALMVAAVSIVSIVISDRRITTRRIQELVANSKF